MSLNIIWAFVAEADQPPTTAQIAAALNLSTSTARRRLKKLREAGRVESLKDGRVTTWRALLAAFEGIRVPVTLKTKPKKVFYQYMDEVSDPPKLEDFPEYQPPIAHTIELAGFDPFTLQADGKWRIFRSFHSGREAERTRYRIACLGWTPPGKGSRQVEVKTTTLRGWPRRTIYEVMVRVMTARKPPKKARG